MRLTPRQPGAYPWYLRPLFRLQKRKYGAVLQSALLWARSPRLFLSIAIFYGALERKGSPLDPALRSLLIVRVSQLNHCPFCVDLNSATLRERGAGFEKIEALADWRPSDLFDARERAALDYAEAVTLSSREVDDDLMDRLKALFSEDAIVELTGLIAFQNMSSKFNSALDVPPQGFCKIPDRTPPTG
ncbi:MAG: carboxymuconolactone decarboxylase family protein [Kiloniellales bacterium]